jgi:hypothetical protein
MRQHLRQIQRWYPEDPELSDAYGVHKKSIKKVSRKIKNWWDVVYSHIARSLNDYIPQ